MAKAKAADDKSLDLRNTSSVYDSMAKYWRMVNAILGGAEALRETSGVTSLGASLAVPGPAIPVSLNQIGRASCRERV